MATLTSPLCLPLLKKVDDRMAMLNCVGYQ
jgi:hypothetical protein